MHLRSFLIIFSVLANTQGTPSRSTTLSTATAGPLEDKDQRTCATLELTNGWVQTTGLPPFVAGDKVYLRCPNEYDLGFVYYGNYAVECHGDGQWYGPEGTTSIPHACVRTSDWCPPPPVVKYSMVKVQGANGQQAVVADNQPSGSVAIYSCIKGYTFDTSSVYTLTCKNNTWIQDGAQPKCVAACLLPTSFGNGRAIAVTLHQNGRKDVIPESEKIRYTCDLGYTLVGSAERTCVQGLWTGNAPACIAMSQRGCSQPPAISHGDYNFYGGTDSRNEDRVVEGSQIIYFCHIGYMLSGDPAQDRLTCQNERWVGVIPECIKQSRCNTPTEIENGNWVILDSDREYSHYSIGMRIRYECDIGYKEAGSTILQCQTSGYWSDNPPKCLEEDMYCKEPANIGHGDYRCTPNHCDMFKVGTQVHYICDQGYEPGGEVQQTCVRGGKWSAEQPACLPVPTTMPVELFSEINSNTMTVVIATSCSVLLLLVVVMIIVAIQRRRPSNHLCHPVEQAPAPPSYTHSPTRTCSIDEHDRVALIASADGLQVVLPSYEEATRGRGGISRVLEPARRLNPGEYRPLPTIPPQLRGRLEQPRPRDPDSHRNSIITTTSSATHDNLSMAFGSVDTMNISDGTSTTTVTLDTCSGASNPSIALSQRAVAGSIASSNGSLANEDVPLLDTHDNPGDVSNGTIVAPADITPEDEGKLAE